MTAEPIEDIFDGEVKVVNIGVTGFADDLEKQRAVVVCVDWKPPLNLDPNLRELLDELL